jgi:hypothetical protein
MEKLTLDKNQISDLVSGNLYPVAPERKFLSRCIDGRYDNRPDLPPLGVPGADAGELALVFAAAREYGFEVDGNKAFKALVEVVGGAKNIQLHTDSHAEKGTVVAGCGHLKQITLDPKAYGLTPDEIDFIKAKMSEAKKKGAEEVVLHGEHLEGAVLLVKGPYSIQPRFILTLGGKREVEVFVYHAGLVDERHRVLAKAYIENKAVKLINDLDEEYLYQVLSETTEDHLMETAKRLAKGLPVYEVVFSEDGKFKIEERGVV